MKYLNYILALYNIEMNLDQKMKYLNYIVALYNIEMNLDLNFDGSLYHHH